jgi:hypothetical protein
MTFTLTAVVKSNGREIEFRGLFFGTRSPRFAYSCTKRVFNISQHIYFIQTRFLDSKWALNGCKMCNQSNIITAK